MTPRRFLVLLLLVGGLAAGLRLAHLESIRGLPAGNFARSWPSSDMHAYREWAESVAAGDWLDRKPFRARFDWQEHVADDATWNRWLGPHTYYQPPLYTYLLALGSRVAGSVEALRWAQAILGAANVVLLGLLGFRLAGPLAGLVAALLAAGYAPFIFYDAEILRGTLVLTLNLLALLALQAAPSAEAAGSGGPLAGRARRAWILAGASLGIAWIGDSAIVTFIPLAALWAFLAPAAGIGEGPRPRAGAIRAAWLAAGLAAALVPLAARNLAVGAPLLSTTTRAPLAFVMGNAPDARPVGAAIPQSTQAIFARSDYGTLATIRETLRAHGGDVGRLAGMQLEKLRGLFNGYEVPDNPSFYYAALHSPVLRSGLRFACLSGLGLVGLLLAARRGRGLLLLHLHLAGVLGIFLFAHVVSRYRQPLVIPLALGAGLAIAEAWRALRDRRFAAFAAILAGGVALSLALPNAPPPGYRTWRPAEFLVAANDLASQGDVGRAAAEIRQALVLADREFAGSGERIGLSLALGELWLAHERYPEALSAYRDVLDEDPRHPEALAAVGGIYQDLRQPMPALEMLLRAESVDPSNAEVQARLGHLFWFVSRDGPRALDHLRRALELAPNAPVAAELSDLAARIAAETGRTP